VSYRPIAYRHIAGWSRNAESAAEPRLKINHTNCELGLYLWGIYKLHSRRINGYGMYNEFISPKMHVATTDFPFNCELLYNADILHDRCRLNRALSCHTLTLDRFYFSIWLSQGVMWGGHSMFCFLCFYVSAGYGSQSGTAVYHCLGLGIILR
jgi:hypothetical protein